MVRAAAAVAGVTYAAFQERHQKYDAAAREAVVSRLAAMGITVEHGGAERREDWELEDIRRTAYGHWRRNEPDLRIANGPWVGHWIAVTAHDRPVAKAQGAFALRLDNYEGTRGWAWRFHRRVHFAGVVLGPAGSVRRLWAHAHEFLPLYLGLERRGADGERYRLVSEAVLVDFQTYFAAGRPGGR